MKHWLTLENSEDPQTLLMLVTNKSQKPRIWIRNKYKKKRDRETKGCGNQQERTKTISQQKSSYLEAYITATIAGSC